MPSHQKKSKATLVLDNRVLEEAREIVRKRSFKSLNSFVQEALEQYIWKARQEDIRESLIEASGDPLFLADLAEIEKDFEQVDVESASLTK